MPEAGPEAEPAPVPAAPETEAQPFVPDAPPAEPDPSGELEVQPGAVRKLLDFLVGEPAPRGGRQAVRRGANTLAASPTMVGALTVMVTILAVFLAYNANSGLPFVPTYRISAEVPNADLLVPTNEVRIGGVRVGTIEAIEPEQDEDGDVSARLDLKLDRDVEPLPVDSTFVVRSRSALGLKYLEIVQRQLVGGLRRGRGGPDRAGDARAGRDRRGAEHVRRSHARGHPAQPGRVR